MDVVMGFPCYRRLHTPLVRSMIEKLLQTDITYLVCGVETEEYYENQHTLPHTDRIMYADVVRGRGCGGDMREVALVMSSLVGNDDVLIMTDDDIIFTEFPDSVTGWAEKWLENNVCAFAYNQDNHFLKQDMAKVDSSDSLKVLRNKGPVLAFRNLDFCLTGGYDPAYHQANDVDIQQRFNILGDSVVNKEWKYKAGVFQEGGMSAFYNVQESRKKYQENTARALYQMKQKYPWLWTSSVSFKNAGTSAVYRVDKEILYGYRNEYLNGSVYMRHTGVHKTGTKVPMRWHLSDEDNKNLSRLEELWNGSKVS